MPEKVKGEGSHERNDTVYIEKMDGGRYIDKDAYLEGGYLHMDDAGWSYRPQTDHKISNFVFNVNGHQATQGGLVYYADEEPIDPLLDQRFVNGVLPATFLRGQEGRLRGDVQADRKSRRQANNIMTMCGVSLVGLVMLLNSNACTPDIYVVADRAPGVVEQIQQPPPDQITLEPGQETPQGTVNGNGNGN